MTSRAKRRMTKLVAQVMAAANRPRPARLAEELAVMSLLPPPRLAEVVVHVS